MVSVQHSINRSLKVKGASQVGGFGMTGIFSQFSICNFRNKNVEQPERNMLGAILNTFVSVFFLLNFSIGAQADEKPVLIEGAVRSSGPQFAWFVEDPATDEAFQKATLEIKSAIDDDGLQALNNETFAIYSHSNLIKNGKLDLNYMQLFKQIPGSEQIANIEIPDRDCVLLPLFASDEQVLNLVAMDYQRDQQDMQMNCFIFALRSALNLRNV
jgi:hypothetical protein